MGIFFSLFSSSCPFSFFASLFAPLFAPLFVGVIAARNLNAVWSEPVGVVLGHAVTYGIVVIAEDIPDFLILGP